MDALEQFFQQVLIPALISILTAAVTAAVGVLIGWIRRKAEQVQSEFAKNVISRAGDAVLRAVQATNQTFADELRVKHSDGKLTTEEAAEAFRRARAYALRMMGDELYAELLKLMGDEASVNGWLSGQIEAAVGEEKLGFVNRAFASSAVNAIRGE